MKYGDAGVRTAPPGSGGDVCMLKNKIQLNFFILEII